MESREISPLHEAEITRTIAREWYNTFDQIISSDVVIIGSGPSGLVCGTELAASGLNVVIIEQLNHSAGDFGMADT